MFIYFYLRKNQHQEVPEEVEKYWAVFQYLKKMDLKHGLKIENYYTVKVEPTMEFQYELPGVLHRVGLGMMTFLRFTFGRKP